MNNPLPEVSGWYDVNHSPKFTGAVGLPWVVQGPQTQVAAAFADRAEAVDYAWQKNGGARHLGPPSGTYQATLDAQRR